ncbi:MAG: glycosyltransferase family 2 protein [Candidatus Fibromonas sp.]|nr:glycosyltransferase family 2 protein [Candidatus Fibromonas sp.]
MISVCMAAYNGEKYIEEQVKSILPQLAENDELIVSDDGSADSTLKILESFDDCRIKIFHHNRNLIGKHPFYPATRNFENALLQAKGDYIFLTDQDDIWLPNKIQTMLPFLKKDNLVISNAWIVNDKLERQSKLSDYIPFKKGFIKNLYRSTTQGCICAFTKKIKEYILPFPEGIIIHDFWIRLLAELKFNTVYIAEPLIYYRRHGENLSDLKKSKNSVFFMIKYRLVMLYNIAKRLYSRK